jgi:hypothetical protein
MRRFLLALTSLLALVPTLLAQERQPVRLMVEAGK